MESEASPMHECRVCGMLFLGGGACPSCGSQIANEIDLSDVSIDEEESIPGLDDVVESLGEVNEDDSPAKALPFGMGAKVEVIESHLPFGVGSIGESRTAVEIPYGESDLEQEPAPEPEPEMPEPTPEPIPEPMDGTTEQQPEVAGVAPQPMDFGQPTPAPEPTPEPEPFVEMASVPLPTVEPSDDSVNLLQDDETLELDISTNSATPIRIQAQSVDSQAPVVIEEPVVGEAVEDSVPGDVPDMWRIDAAAVDMDEIYSQDDQVVEVSFGDDLGSGDVEVNFDDFNDGNSVQEQPENTSPELHPAKALAVDAAGEPEIARMINQAFEHMSSGSWTEAAHLLSTASANRQNDSAILNNLGLALLQSALEMDSEGDAMSSSQFESAILALRKAAKIDTADNTILLNLAHALLVSGRAEKALNVVRVLCGREIGNVEADNVHGACLIQLGMHEDARNVLSKHSADPLVSANLALI